MPNFVSFAASIAELAHDEKLRSQSINHPTSLFDAPGTALRNNADRAGCVWGPLLLHDANRAVMLSHRKLLHEDTTDLWDRREIRRVV